MEAAGFELLSNEDIPLIIREHVRYDKKCATIDFFDVNFFSFFFFFIFSKFQLIVADLSIWRKIK